MVYTLKPLTQPSARGKNLAKGTLHLLLVEEAAFIRVRAPVFPGGKLNA